MHSLCWNFTQPKLQEPCVQDIPRPSAMSSNIFFPSLWSLGGWCGYFPGLTSSTSSSSPALGLRADKNGEHLSKRYSNLRNMYIEQNAWRWTRSFNRVKAIFGFFRQASAPWHVPRRSTQTTIANRNRCLQVFQYLKAWNQASEVHQQNAKKSKFPAQAHFKIQSRKLWRWRKAEVWPPSSQPPHEKTHWISTSDTERSEYIRIRSS